MKTHLFAVIALSSFTLISACKPQSSAQQVPKKTIPKTEVKVPAANKNVHAQAARAKQAAVNHANAPAKKGGDWNESGIKWLAFEPGLHQAKADHKPICLIFSTEWCPHCRTYSGVFHDPKVVEMSKNFIMIHLDKSKNKELSKRFAPDGEYIPRTFFLNTDGLLDESQTAGRPKYKYFYNEKDPQHLLKSMRAFLLKTK